ncbi:MAG: MarR family winged helix-turn-helix transcriptional regulator [Eubacterium sp.]|nr:MarR family winged helix-turn-helix transcriptional regulator [Eubacterium sp.]
MDACGERHIGMEVKILSTLIDRRMNERIAEDSQGGGLTRMQGMVIRYLEENEDAPVFQRDIEKRFDIRRSTATSILQLMEKNGLIAKEAVDYDARLKRIIMTPKARAVQDHVCEIIKDFEAELKTGLSDGEVAIFFELLDKIKNNIK